MTDPTSHAVWNALQAKAADVKQTHLSDLNANTGRESMRATCGSLTLDYSYQRVTKEILDSLFTLAKAQDFEAWRKRLFDGEAINASENRSVLHMALRAREGDSESALFSKVRADAEKTRTRMAQFANNLRDGIHVGYSGEPITDVINIGIGGSDLGPRMVVHALSHLHDGPRVHFVANVDGADISATLKKCQAEKTLFIIASKTFTTAETLMNAQTAKTWFLEHADTDDISRHFVALSTNADVVQDFGLSTDLMFPFDEAIGGRFSLWSSIGLSIMLAVGSDNFQALLEGARDMDQHFLNAQARKNIPLLMGLLGVWERNFMDSAGLALLPYAQNLSLLSDYMQQLDMESNGKSINRDGNPIKYATSPIIFGQVGTNGQHAFHQALHQGTDIIPADFIIIRKSLSPELQQHHRKLLANALAQRQALAFGEKDSGFAGGRPSSLIMLDELTPHTLGSLIAAYEHKIFVQGVIWNLNSFDQPGVELGKVLAQDIETHPEKTEFYAKLFE
ncbi:MAG: glucose-6-phosphate isomerase [Micavibrio sp.]|nr:glucose-6-phosphate isomerase [Micavibrio sp.]|tara:strand:+ start:812163 stop:813686 length:1524 start_codon:yes stop_codon:yes gene_type:complete